MRDSLDLGLLQSQNIASRKAVRRTWMICIVVISGFVALMLMLAVLSSSPNSRQTSCSKCSSTIIALLIAVLPLFILIASGVTFYINRRRNQKHANTIRQQLPKLALPPPVKSYENEIVAGSSIVLIAIGLIWKIEAESVLWGIFIISVAITLVLFGASIWVRTPFQHGDYDGAIRRANITKGWLKGNFSILSLEGLALMFAGKSVESEQVHLQFLAQTQKMKIYDWLAYNNYGVELTYQGRYPEALTILEAGIRLQPHISCTYDSLANWYLYQSIEPERALELSKLGFKLPSTWVTGLRDISKSSRLATRAWAEARTGNVDAARATLSKAIKISNTQNVPIKAEIYRIAGETNLALDDLAAARDHFQKAVQLDPHGRIGKLAQQALDKIA